MASFFILSVEKISLGAVHNVKTYTIS